MFSLSSIREDTGNPDQEHDSFQPPPRQPCPQVEAHRSADCDPDYRYQCGKPSVYRQAHQCITPPTSGEQVESQVDSHSKAYPYDEPADRQCVDAMDDRVEQQGRHQTVGQDRAVQEQIRPLVDVREPLSRRQTQTQSNQGNQTDCHVLLTGGDLQFGEEGMVGGVWLSGEGGQEVFDGLVYVGGALGHGEVPGAVELDVAGAGYGLVEFQFVLRRLAWVVHSPD